MDALEETEGQRQHKGQRLFTWTEPGEWTHIEDLQLAYHSIGLGEDERGMTTRMVLVKYDGGARVEPH